MTPEMELHNRLMLQRPEQTAQLHPIRAVVRGPINNRPPSPASLLPLGPRGMLHHESAQRLRSQQERDTPLAHGCRFPRRGLSKSSHDSEHGGAFGCLWGQAEERVQVLASLGTLP